MRTTDAIAIKIDGREIGCPGKRGPISTGATARKGLCVNQGSSVTLDEHRAGITGVIGKDIVARYRDLKKHVSGRGAAVRTTPARTAVGNISQWRIWSQHNHVLVDHRHRSPFIDAIWNGRKICGHVVGVAADRHVPDTGGCKRLSIRISMPGSKGRRTSGASVPTAATPAAGDTTDCNDEPSRKDKSTQAGRANGPRAYELYINVLRMSVPGQGDSPKLS